MKYEKPSLVALNGASSKFGYGLDCVPGGTADSKCEPGGYTSGGDCNSDGANAGGQCNIGPTAGGDCKAGDIAVSKCAPGGTYVQV